MPETGHWEGVSAVRSERDVFRQILDFAQGDDRIHVVLLNGSRANRNAPRDMLQDYDVVCFVQDLPSAGYKRDRSWIGRFGELVIVQQNDGEAGSYIFLMQFADGVRIDLTFEDLGRVRAAASEDTLTEVLLDKGGILGALPEPSDAMYWVPKPSQAEWSETLNELWWIQPYVAKGLWRDELPYAKHMYDCILMECVRRLLSWQIGLEHGWRINVGKHGKWFKRLLRRDLYDEFSALYPGADYGDIWDKLFAAGALIRQVGVPLAESLGCAYPMQDDINVSEFIRRMRRLPPGARSLDQ